jgi:fructosamine-3-kinase
MERSLAADIEAAVGSKVLRADGVHGGDVAIAYRLDLDDGRRVFAKTHRAPPPGFFVTEALGLSWLAEPAAVDVPAVLAVSDGPPAFLVLSWIDRGPAEATTDADFGRRLSTLHGAGAPCFGREDRRTTGSRALPNEPTATWSEFYATCRLLPLARLARDAGALEPASIDRLVTLAGHLDRLGAPAEPAARLHGDLWAGNRVVGTGGRSWLIDPAAHGGHREFDLAMMRLFGGFGPSCFAAYEEEFPLADGWEERVTLHQIAPLVVHAIKFGGGYVGAARQAIARYVGG